MKVSELKQHIDEQFAGVDQRFAGVDQRFASIDQRFASIDQRFANIDQRFANIDQQFANIDQQFADIKEDMDRRFSAVDARIVEEGRITRRHFDVVAEDLKREIRTLAATVAASQRTLDENRSEHQTFSAALSDHELRLIALEHRRRRKP